MTDVDGIFMAHPRPSHIERVIPNACHGLCAQHRLDRNLVNDTKYKAMIAAAKDKNAAARAEVDMILRWLWQFTKTYENPEEIDFSEFLLNHYMNEAQDHHFAALEEEFR